MLRALCLLLAAVVAVPAGAQDDRRTIVAVFAHPDDERIVGPLLARYAREGHRVHLIVATDGAKGVREHAGIPAGPALAEARAVEARCATDRLGIELPILLGLEDAGLASFAALGRLREALAFHLDALRPDVLLTVGPEGGTGHADHRLVSNVLTELVQGSGDPPALYYASLPAERVREGPTAWPAVTPLPARLLPLRVPFEAQDLTASEAAFACHATQYTPEEREAVNRMLAHGFGWRVHLRPWYGPAEPREDLFP
jgi:LmbE family N-acetylglucosaminyl deacetylase